MESLYTKYRPQTFADVVGQTHVVTTLQHAVMEGRISHAYLFCGPRGTGKTTMARLLAKALMCELGEGHLPDGTCEQCRLIAAGEHPDVYELDAASRTGVDNVREEIISRVSFAPVRGRYKMYIIDEVHMLTTAAFNALLKTLEEPPAHVVFVLCTTDPQKIPETILSRVQRFDFHAIGNADIQARLAYICEREGFGYDPDALELVVRHARGGMRDAISELEQLSVSGAGTIGLDVARDVLGEVSASTLEKMSLAMANRDVPTLFAQVESLVEVGRDLLQFTRAMSVRLRDVYVVAAIGAKSAAVSASEAELPALSREALAFGSVDRVGRALQLLSDASTEMRVAPNQRLVLEVALTKIARPQAELTLEALADRVATLERQVAALSVPEARREAQAAPAPVRREVGVAAPAPAPAAPAEAPSVPARPAGQETTAQRRAVPEQRPVREAPVRPQARPQEARSAESQAAPRPVPAANPAPAPTPVPAPAPVSAVPAVSDPGELQRRWKQVVDSLLATRPQHGSLLLSSTIVSDDGVQILVSLPKGSGWTCKMLDRPDVRAGLDPAIARAFGPRKAIFAEEGAVAAMVARGAVVQAAQVAPASAPSRAHAPQAPDPAPQAPRQQDAPARTSAPAAAPAASEQPTGHALPRQDQARSASSTRQAPAALQHPTPATSPSSAHEVPAAPPQVPGQGGAPAASPYPAPWEPLPDDQVPYDDVDAAPYEEDYLFGTVDDAPTPRRVPTPAQTAAAPLAATQAAPETTVPTSAPAAQPQTASSQPSVPQPAAQQELRPTPEPHPAPASQPAPEPAANPTSAPAPDRAPAPAATPDPAPEPPARRPRASRQTAGVPNDLAAMLTSVFGEDITFTELPPTEPDEDFQEESALAEQAFDGENEYADEPVDDADYEESDD